MRRAFAFGFVSARAGVARICDALAAGSNKSLATITGSVQDNQGNPLAGAFVSLLREGVKKPTSKRQEPIARADFMAKVQPGRYGIRAIANGFTRSLSRR